MKAERVRRCYVSAVDVRFRHTWALLELGCYPSLPTEGRTQKSRQDWESQWKLAWDTSLFLTLCSFMPWWKLGKQLDLLSQAGFCWKQSQREHAGLSLMESSVYTRWAVFCPQSPFTLQNPPGKKKISPLKSWTNNCINCGLERMLFLFPFCLHSLNFPFDIL